MKKIRSDRFKVNYYKDGARIDKVLGSGTLFEGFLKDSRSTASRTPVPLNFKTDGMGTPWVLGSPTIGS